MTGSNFKPISQVYAHTVDSKAGNLHQSTSYDNFIFYSVKTNFNPILVSGQLNNVDVKMELETGATRSLIRMNLFGQSLINLKFYLPQKPIGYLEVHLYQL